MSVPDTLLHFIYTVRDVETKFTEGSKKFFSENENSYWDSKFKNIDMYFLYYVSDQSKPIVLTVESDVK